MKIKLAVFFLLVLAILLAGCGKTSVPLSAGQVAQTSTAEAVSGGAGAHENNGGTGGPVLMSTLDPGKLPKQLGRAFLVGQAGSFNGHALRRVSGWNYGFRRGACGGYRWLDPTHLLLYPLIGQDQLDGSGPVDRTRPVVVNLETGASWLPDYEAIWDCEVPRWSPEIDQLIVYVGGIVSTYTADGERKVDYKGILRGISPTNTKILAEDQSWMWIDLLDGNIKYLTFDMEPQGGRFSLPIWSKSELRVYGCCYFYGNARNGESYGFASNEIATDDGLLPGRYYMTGGSWVLDDSRVLVRWADSNSGDTPGFIPLFDPVKKVYHNLNVLAGIPSVEEGGALCTDSTASPDGTLAWITCGPRSYLVMLTDFKSWAYTGNYKNFEWSADGKFALLGQYDEQLRRGNWQVLTVADGHLRDLPVSPDARALAWHPVENSLAYLSEDGHTLTLLDAAAWSIRKLDLPAAFRDVIWNPPGDRVALVADDGSLWQVAYADPQSPEQLTPSAPDVRDVHWSEDGQFLAWISASNLWTVDTVKK